MMPKLPTACLSLVLALASAAPAAAASTQRDATTEALAVPGATAASSSEQRQIAGRFILRNAKMIAFLAHPTLDLDDFDAFIDDDAIVLKIEYAPSAILGNRYETTVRYELGASGIISSQVLRDTALTSAFGSLELVRELAAELLRDARREEEDRGNDVSAAARALELALSQDVSGNRIHLLVLRLAWASDDASDRYRGA